jgi:LAGLIDADG DNA endonuclease family
VRLLRTIFKKERNLWYPNGVKTVPQDLHLFINAEALAAWFMDDGGRNSAFGSGMIIDVSKFSKSCQLYLQKLLLKNFSLV